MLVSCIFSIYNVFSSNIFAYKWNENKILVDNYNKKINKLYTNSKKTLY